jgi:tRNA(fMet)-specific endonuclease VapC
MRVMLDTNICIHIIRRRPQSVLERFGAFAVGDIGLSAITLAELEYGASNSRDPRRNRDALQRFAAPLEVSSFDRAATQAYGRIRTVLERKGWPIGPMDLLIAAHALSLGVRLVTSNEGEFKRVPGLVVENWL